MKDEPDDILRAATRALREETASPGNAARFTRLRVMSSLRESEVRRRTQTVLLLPFAACLAVASAWGMAVGTITEMREAFVRTLGVNTPPPRSADPPEKRRVPRAVKPPVVAPPIVSAPVVAPPAETEPSPPPPPTAEAPVTPPPIDAPKGLDNPLTRPARARAEAADPAHELYRAAHNAHFVSNDWSRALSAWDAYLRAAPRGRLAPEARYNRALCLVRLGRTAQAREALEPFAQAKAGSYRQREASELLGVLAEN
jgi:hypothetical protein